MEQYHFGPYILELQFIWSLHLITVKLIHVIFSMLTIWIISGKRLHSKQCEIGTLEAYVTNKKNYWH